MKFSKNISMNMLILFFVVAMGLFIWVYYSNKLHEGARSSSKCSNGDPDRSKCNDNSRGISYIKCNGNGNGKDKILSCTRWGWQ
jgi:hypothetical protein